MSDRYYTHDTELILYRVLFMMTHLPNLMEVVIHGRPYIYQGMESGTD